MDEDSMERLYFKKFQPEYFYGFFFFEKNLFLEKVQKAAKKKLFQSPSKSFREK